MGIASISEFVHQASVYRDFAKLVRNGEVINNHSLLSFISPEVQRRMSLPPSPNDEYKDCDVIFALAALVTPKSFRIGLKTFVEDIHMPTKDFHFQQSKTYVQSFNKRVNLLHVCIRNVNAEDVSTLVLDAFIAAIQPEPFRTVVQAKAASGRWGVKETQEASLKEWEGLQKSIDTAVFYGILPSKSSGTNDEDPGYNQRGRRNLQHNTPPPYQRPWNGIMYNHHSHDKFSPPSEKHNRKQPRLDQTRQRDSRSRSPRFTHRDQNQQRSVINDRKDANANGQHRRSNSRSPPRQLNNDAVEHRIPKKRRRVEDEE